MKKFLNYIFNIFKTIAFGLLIILAGLVVLLILLILIVIILSPILPKSDYCLEDGDCNAGRIIIVEDKEIEINKDTCIKNNWDWYEKSQYCKIKNTMFHPKEIIYD